MRIKRIISFILTFVIALSMMPMQAFAEEPTPEAQVDTGDVTIEGTNGFGSLLSEAISEEQSEIESKEDTAYTVTDLEIADNVATVTYDSMEEAVLIVALYTEDGMQLLTSGKATVTPEETVATVVFEGTMPMYFMASAYLVDVYDLSPLCPAYDTPMYTQEMQELLASTVQDYDQERVLNLDDDETTNFAVYADTTKIIEYVEGYNIVASADEENNTYVIENADEQILSLGQGDIFAYSYGENDILIAKVASLFSEGTTVTIIGTEIEIEEVFSHLKIESQGSTTDVVVDEQSGDDSVTYIGKQGDSPYSTKALDGGVELEKELAFKVKKEINEYSSISGSLGVKFKIEFDYYISLKRAYLKFEMGPEINMKIEYKFEDDAPIPFASSKLKLHSFGYRPVPGVFIGFEPEVIVEFNATVSLSAKLSCSTGFSIEFGEGIEDLSTKPKLSVDVKVEGSIFLGIDFNPHISICKDKVAKIKLSSQVGLEIKGKATGTHYDDVVYVGKMPDKIHDCERCLKITLEAKLELSADIKILNAKWLTYKGKILGKVFDLGVCHYSATYSDFGWGECPHKSYHTLIEVRTSDGTPVCGSVVTVNEESVETNQDGIASLYLPGNIHIIKATYKNLSRNQPVTVKDSAKIVIMLPSEGESSSGGTGGGSFDDSIWGTIVSEEIIDHGAVVASGNCGALGDNVTWTLYKDGLLKFSGTGKMKNYSYDNTPWYSTRFSIRAVYIESGITNTGNYLFYNCSSLIKVTIPNSVTEIGVGTFNGCSSLSNIMIPEGVISIGSGAFYRCDSLLSITIPDSVSTIGSSAFSSCSSLTSVTFGKGVTKIDKGIFSWDRELTDVTFLGNAPKFATDVFSYSNRTNVNAYYPADNPSWTADVMQNYGGKITWIPYTLDENGDMIINEAAAVTMAADTVEDEALDVLGEDAVVQAGMDATVSISDQQNETLEFRSIIGGDYGTEVTDTYTIKTASFAGLVPGQQYILLALKSIDAEDPLSSNNLLFIDQAAALEDGTLKFTYVQRENTNLSYVMACGASDRNLADAEITFPEMTANGELQVVGPTVVYEGENLEEGRDYVIVGSVSFTEAGEFTCYIRGIRRYTGLVECVYQVQENTATQAIGDVNLDGTVDMDDVVVLMRHVLKAEEILDTTSLANSEVTGDASLDMDDVVKLMQYVLKAIDSLA